MANPTYDPHADMIKQLELSKIAARRRGDWIAYRRFSEALKANSPKHNWRGAQKGRHHYDQ